MEHPEDVVILRQSMTLSASKPHWHAFLTPAVGTLTSQRRWRAAAVAILVRFLDGTAAAVLTWRHADHFAKLAAEVVAVIEANVVGDFGDAAAIF